MSISRTQFEPYGVQMKVPKKRVNVKKIAEKTVKEFKDNTIGVILIICIVLTGIGEMIGNMSIRWYIFLYALLLLYSANYYKVRVRPLLELFSGKNKKYG